MRTKHFLLILCCVVITTIIFIILGPSGEPNDSLKSIVSHTHQQLNKLQENLRKTREKKFEVDPKYLAILGFTNSVLINENQFYKYNIFDVNAPKQNGNDETEIYALSQSQNKAQQQQQQQQQQHGSLSSVVTTTPFNGTKANFTIVTYVVDGQAPSAILLAQNIATKFPNEYLLIYDLGLSEEESRALNAYCNNTKCAVIVYDLSIFPSYISDQRMHAYRSIVIKDALMRSKCILFTENYMRIRGNTSELNDLKNKVMVSGVLGWNTPIAVSARTHPKMFDYFQTDADKFYFLRMIDLDAVLFADSLFVTEKIMLPWLKCVLTLECIDPIGAQSNGCKYNKKPQYRYSGCHSYDTSAFNIVLGNTWHQDDSKYSLPSETSNIFYKETLEQATKILENRRRNNSETSEHPFTEE